MENFRAKGNETFRYAASITPLENNRQRFVMLDVMYLAGSSRKGVLASLKTVEVEKCEGYSTETSVLFGDGNFSTWVKVQSRKNLKELVAVVEALDSKVVDIVAAFALDRANGKALLLSAIESLSPAA